MNPKIESFFEKKGWEMHPYQKRALKAYENGKNLLITAPTGTGKTYAAWMPILNSIITRQTSRKPGLKVLWITPLRALTNDISKALASSASELGLDIRIETRTGDTSSYSKNKQRKSPPDVLVTTPESIHVLLSYKGAKKFFNSVESVVIDEFHEMLTSKRGTLVDLATSYIKTNNPNARFIAISATLGNITTGLSMLGKQTVHIDSEIQKQLITKTIYPKKIESYSWAGHLGTRLVKEAVNIIEKHKSIILFANTRRLAEFWYKALLETSSQLAGRIAIHHGSLSKDTRGWVEENLGKGKLKAVVATSSLDLGIDFRPVEAVIQIGSPKGVSRFIQRAGRAGHRPGEKSIVYFLPTNTLELLESSAIKASISSNEIEEKYPISSPYDVLIQFLLTLACGDGFSKVEVEEYLKNSYAFKNVDTKTLDSVISFIVTGGKSLSAYDEYKKVTFKNGTYNIPSRKLQINHRVQIGTIVSSPLIQVKYLTGGSIGKVEEAFLARFSPGDTFYFAGRLLKYVRLELGTLYVRRSKDKESGTSGYIGGRAQLSSTLAEVVRLQLTQYVEDKKEPIEYVKLKPLLKLQKKNSSIPSGNRLVTEYLQTKEGHHLYLYPLAGRILNEGIGALLAYRISKEIPITFSIAMNDFGVELLTATPIPKRILSTLPSYLSRENLEEDLVSGVNIAELSKRKFEEIAQISGLVFKGRPGRYKSSRNIQSSSKLLYELFKEYDTSNLLLNQAEKEALNDYVHKDALALHLERLENSTFKLNKIERSTPFSFAIMVDRLRTQLSSEKLSTRIKRMLGDENYS